jgi:hypothetical protein
MIVRITPKFSTSQNKGYHMLASWTTGHTSVQPQLIRPLVKWKQPSPNSKPIQNPNQTVRSYLGWAHHYWAQLVGSTATRKIREWPNSALCSVKRTICFGTLWFPSHQILYKRISHNLSEEWILKVFFSVRNLEGWGMENGHEFKHLFRSNDLYHQVITGMDSSLSWKF